MDNGCLFCKIIEGAIPSHKLYEDDEILAILDIYPCHVGEALVLPKTHYENIFDINRDVYIRIMDAARGFIPAMRQAAGFDGINLMQNNGEAAGAEIGHFHLHLIPRYQGDGVVKKGKRLSPSDGELKKYAEAFREAYGQGEH